MTHTNLTPTLQQPDNFPTLTRFVESLWRDLGQFKASDRPDDRDRLDEVRQQFLVAMARAGSDMEEAESAQAS